MSRELDKAIEASEIAGDVLRKSFGSSLDVQFKGPIDLVTEVDVESEKTVVRVLREAFPSYGFLTEESGHSGSVSDARWIIDPLDGTTNYTHALPLFAVSIALEVKGKLSVGVVYNPISGEMFAAEAGGGATLNGQLIHVSSQGQLRRSLIVTGIPYEASYLDDSLRLWDRFVRTSQGVRRLGSAALDLCWTAMGRFDGYYERGIHSYDIAAGCLILEEAGGTLSSFTGAELDLEARECVGSNGPIHSAMVKLTSQVV